jgi:hypothetical protein
MDLLITLNLQICISFFSYPRVEVLKILVDRKVAGSLNFFVDGTQSFWSLYFNHYSIYTHYNFTA